MTRRHPAAYVLISALAAGCGGGSTDTVPGAQAATYRFVGPKVAEHLVYAQKLTDNLNNTINRTMVRDVTAVSADGSFTLHEQDPSNNRIVSGTVDQSLYPTTFQYNASGQLSSSLETRSPSDAVSCTDTQGNPGPPSPMTVGQGWTADYIETCGTGAGIAFAQSGTLAGLETITVAAGTFSAFKFTSTVTWTANGITRTETVSQWRDASSADSHLLKSASAIAYTGATPPAGELVSETNELQSIQ
jgi:hypothetical protein